MSQSMEFEVVETGQTANGKIYVVCVWQTGRFRWRYTVSSGHPATGEQTFTAGAGWSRRHVVKRARRLLAASMGDEVFKPDRGAEALSKLIVSSLEADREQSRGDGS